MSSTWSKLRKTLGFNKGSSSSRNLPPLPPNQSNSGTSGQQSPSSNTNGHSSSFSSRWSRSFNSTGRSSSKTCAICLNNLKSGQDQAIFTAECSHSFHFKCIANNVKHGNHICPICRFRWKEIPSQLSNATVDANRAHATQFQTPHDDHTTVTRHARAPPSANLVRYDDDELLVVPTNLVSLTSDTSSNNVSIKSFTEFPALASRDSVCDFSVLVNICAPPLLDSAQMSHRAPVDLVMVLDVSGSMSGSKLVLLKKAACFVIENLGATDRLSIVCFSATSHRVLPLRRMTEGGRVDARLALGSLRAHGGTDIVQGLKQGARVLEERRGKNSVANIILLSDGKDTYNLDTMCTGQNQIITERQFTEFLNLLPVSIVSLDQHPTFLVHTFGFGADHDSSSMHAISNASGGTFSFIESVVMVQDAFARCIGGLLSVVAQEFQLTVTSASDGVKILSIPSGRYSSEISEQGLEGVIKIRDLYADEKKEFLIHLSVPIAEGEKTPLLKIACSYKNTSEATVQLECRLVEIRRQDVLDPIDYKTSLEVDREKNRLSVAESIANAQQMAENGNFEGAQAVLTDSRSALLSSDSAQAGDALCSRLESELTEIRERMANMQSYTQTGRAYALSGLSSHSSQRATTRGDITIMTTGGSSTHSGVLGYNTPSMVTMVSMSQNLSLEGNQQPNKNTV